MPMERIVVPPLNGPRWNPSREFFLIGQPRKAQILPTPDGVSRSLSAISLAVMSQSTAFPICQIWNAIAALRASTESSILRKVPQ